MRVAGSCESLVDDWRSPETPWHCNWAAASGVTIVASQTAEDQDDNVRLVRGSLGLPLDARGLTDVAKKVTTGVATGVVTSATMGAVSSVPILGAKGCLLPEWVYRTGACGVLNCGAMNVLDPDLGAYWTSGKLAAGDDPTAASAGSTVTVTLDLGAPRAVDKVCVVWGDAEALPMPKEWQLLGSAEGSGAEAELSAEEVLASTTGAELQAAGTVRGGAPRTRSRVVSRGLAARAHRRARLAMPSRGVWQRPFVRDVQCHEEGVSCSHVAISPAKTLKVLQLKLTVPQSKAANAGRVGYSIRQMLVIGPTA